MVARAVTKQAKQLNLLNLKETSDNWQTNLLGMRLFLCYLSINKLQTI